ARAMTAAIPQMLFKNSSFSILMITMTISAMNARMFLIKLIKISSFDKCLGLVMLLIHLSKLTNALLQCFSILFMQAFNFMLRRSSNDTQACQLVFPHNRSAANLYMLHSNHRNKLIGMK